MKINYTLVMLICLLWTIPLSSFVIRNKIVSKGIRKIGSWLGRLEQIVAMCLLGLAIVIGSTKEDVETPQAGGLGQEAGGTFAPSPSFAPNAQSPMPNACLTAEQLSAGFALVEVRTNEVHDFTAPTNAIVYRPWRLRGAVDDGIYLVNSQQSVVNSDGTNTIQNS